MTEQTNPLAGDDDSGDAGMLPPAVTPPAVTPAPAAKAAKAAKEPKEPKEPKAAKADAPAAPKRVNIILEENDNIPPTGLFIGVNGRSYMLRAGVKASVPVEVVEALNDAVEARPQVDPNNNVVDYRMRLRFPYRLLAD